MHGLSRLTTESNGQAWPNLEASKLRRSLGKSESRMRLEWLVTTVYVTVNYCYNALADRRVYSDNELSRSWTWHTLSLHHWKINNIIYAVKTLHIVHFDYRDRYRCRCELCSGYCSVHVLLLRRRLRHWRSPGKDMVRANQKIYTKSQMHSRVVLNQHRKLRRIEIDLINQQVTVRFLLSVEMS